MLVKAKGNDQINGIFGQNRSVSDLRRVIEGLRPRWRWIVALGVLIAGIGVAALVLVVSATIAAVYTIAVFMIVAGAAEIATGLGAQRWRRFVVWIIAGLAYIVVAVFALAQLLIAAAFFGLALGAGMIATGVVRIYLGAHLGAPLRRPVGAHGAGWAIDRRGLAGE